jgi:hypothetical protein
MRKKSKKSKKSNKKNKSNKSKSSNPFIKFAHGRTKVGKKLRQELTKDYYKKYGKPSGKDVLTFQNYIIKKMSEIWNLKYAKAKYDTDDENS